jgi:hypothetical protein
VIEGWKFLQCWEKTAIPVLSAAGYKVKGDNALRTVDIPREAPPRPCKALHLLSLIRDQKKGFTISLAFAHDFARSFRDGKPVQMTGYEEAVVQTRVGSLLEKEQKWWPYGKTEKDTESTILALAQFSIAAGDAWFGQLADPGGLYLMLKKGDLGDENLWHLAIYADALGRRDEAIDWLDRMKLKVSHVSALKKEWGKAS